MLDAYLHFLPIYAKYPLSVIKLRYQYYSIKCRNKCQKRQQMCYTIKILDLQ